jgi:enoyl-[acyl-carrier protein] reductase II
MMKKNSRVAQLLGIQYPILQAPMNWLTSAELAAAVSNAGGFGILGPNAGQTEKTADREETVERMRREIRKTRGLTDKPFGAELIVSFCPDEMSEALLQAYCEEDVNAVLFLNNEVPKEYVDRIHDAGKIAIHKSIFSDRKTLIAAQEKGFDAIVYGSSDAGGHMNPVNFGTLSAIRTAREVVDVPLIAAGGIVDGLTVQIAGMLGAEGVYCGTRFVACTECPAHDSIKQLYVDTTSDQLVQVSGLFGPVRSVRTPVIDQCLELMAAPKENAGRITGTYSSGYKTAMLDGDLEHGLLDCGGAIDQIKSVLSAQEIVDELAKGME